MNFRAWLKNGCQKKIILKGEENEFSSKTLKIMIGNFSKYIVTEIKIFFRRPCIKENEFHNQQSYKFWVKFLFMMSNITSVQGHSSESFITLKFVLQRSLNPSLS